MAKATRQAFGEKLAELGKEHPEIVVLDADLAKSTKSEIFAAAFPERFFEMGISEANMIGTAVGLSFSGKLPFLCSFGAFITGRYDTIRLSAAYAQANIRMVGTHAGVGIGDDGHSQMGLEDVALMRALPGMGVFQPMDEAETHLMMDYLVNEWKGPAYLRLTRQNLPDFFPKGQKVDPLKLLHLRGPARDAKVACIATGGTVGEAMAASEELERQGIAMSVWNAGCLKPFDDETLLKIAGDSGLLVTVEDHSVVGGLGTCAAEAIAGTLSRKPVAPLVKLGIQDTFGESGEPAELYEKHGISAGAISRRVASLVKELEL